MAAGLWRVEATLLGKLLDDLHHRMAGKPSDTHGAATVPLPAAAPIGRASACAPGG